MSNREEADLEELAVTVGDAMNRRDSDALLALAHPDYEFNSRFAAVERGLYQGPEGMRTYFRDLDEAFVDVDWKLLEVVDAPGDDVVAVFRFVARGRESGVPVDLVTPMVWTFRDGKLWRNAIYRSKDEALEAAGRRSS
jgi:ketosteroid isomerase-like protein